jgi:hypothetical protein
MDFWLLNSFLLKFYSKEKVFLFTRVTQGITEIHNFFIKLAVKHKDLIIASFPQILLFDTTILQYHLAEEGQQPP